MPEEKSISSLDQQGQEAFAKGEYELAARLFSDAAAGYTASGEVLKATEMNSNQSVALLRAGHLEEALTMLDRVCGVFEKADDTSRLGIALGNKATVLSALKRWNEAIKFYEEAAIVLERAGEDENRLIVKRQAASLYATRFKFIDALLAVRDGYLGLHNPSLKQRIVKKLLFIGQ